MSKLIPIWVCDGDVLEEGEVNSTVGNRESRESNCLNGDFGSFGFEEEEVSDNNACNKKDQEDSGTNT